jgi:hypothetical protein
MKKTASDTEFEQACESTLARFPLLKRCRDTVPSRKLAETYLGGLLLALHDSDVDFETAGLETVLAILFERHTTTDISEQIDGLFYDGAITQSKKKWNAASSELYAFSYFEGLRILASLGWPPSGYGKTPPFDSMLRMEGVFIPCDVKAASGNAFLLIRTALEKIVRDWDMSRGTKVADICLRYRGTLSQQKVGPVLEPSMQAFAAALRKFDEIPGTALPLDVGGLRCEVTLSPGHSKLLSGGVQGTDALARSLVDTLLNHVTHKSVTAAANGGRPFAIVYVQLPGTGGSDVKTSHIFEKSARDVAADRILLVNDADSLWLGMILLDYKVEPPKVYCYLRQDAMWPDGLSPKQFAHTACGRLVVI